LGHDIEQSLPAFRLVGATYQSSASAPEKDGLHALSPFLNEYGLFLRSTYDNWMHVLFRADKATVVPSEETLRLEYIIGSGSVAKQEFSGTAREIILNCTSQIDRRSNSDPSVRTSSLLSSDLKFDVAVLTVARPLNYLDRTVASLGLSGLLGASGLLHFICGAPSCSHLEHYSTGFSKVRVHMLEEDLHERWRMSKTSRKVFLSYAQFFRSLASNSVGVLVVEDDVVLGEYVLEDLMRAVQSIKDEYYVLVVHANRDFDILMTRVPFSGRNWTPVDAAVLHPSANPDWFWGLQAMYYPAPVLSALAQYFKLFLDRADEWDSPADAQIDIFCRTLKVPMYAIPVSNVSHIGTVSTLQPSVAWSDTATSYTFASP